MRNVSRTRFLAGLTFLDVCESTNASTTNLISAGSRMSHQIWKFVKDRWSNWLLVPGFLLHVVDGSGLLTTAATAGTRLSTPSF